MLLKSFYSKTPLSETDDNIVLPEKWSAFDPMSVTVLYFLLD